MAAFIDEMKRVMYYTPDPDGPTLYASGYYIHKGVLLSNWDTRFMDLAHFIASWSKDPTTKVGAVIVGNNQHQISLGYNGFPAGIRDTPERLNNRDVKHLLTQHAERNALDNATFDTRTATLYCTQIPCTKHGCSLSVISKGIHRVVCPPVPEKEPWNTDARETERLFAEAGIKLTIADRFFINMVDAR